jgi:hypothetical protein
MTSEGLDATTRCDVKDPDERREGRRRAARRALAGPLLLLAASAATGCMLPPGPSVIADFHAAGCGQVFIRRCALESARGRPRFRDCEDEVQLVDGDAASACLEKRKAELQATEGGPAAPPPVGALGIVSFPTGASLEVDGKEVGRAPLLLSKVSLGTHHIQARWADGAAATLEQAVGAGAVTARLFRP